MKYAPIVVFVYKRAVHTEQCLQALSKSIGADLSDLIIFCDGPKTENDKADVSEVRTLVKEFAATSVFRSVKIIESEENNGLANSIISGVSMVLEQYGRVIVVEDDLIVSDDFLQYMNGALEYYKNNPEIGSISAYTYPIDYLKNYSKDIYVIRKGECWGWATWKDRWDQVDWEVKDFNEYKKSRKQQKAFKALEYGLDNMLKCQMEGKIDSWAVRWCFHLFKNGLLTVYPSVSRAKNIGMDGSGTHCQQVKGKGADLYSGVKTCEFELQEVNPVIEKQVAVFEKESFAERCMRYIKAVKQRFGK